MTTQPTESQRSLQDQLLFDLEAHCIFDVYFFKGELHIVNEYDVEAVRRIITTKAYPFVTKIVNEAENYA